MLEATISGEVDASVANISITADHGRVMDFSQPNFSADLQMMIPAKAGSDSGIWQIITSADVLLAVIMAFALFKLREDGSYTKLWHKWFGAGSE